MEVGKFIRYFLICASLNLIFALIGYGTLWISRLFDWQWNNWEFWDWWVFISIYIYIGGVVVYLTPFIEQKLYNVLQNRLITLTENQIEAHKKTIIELELELQKLKKTE